ncbi:MAG: S8 family serine peptidase [Nannocystaceae bacterium]
MLLALSACAEDIESPHHGESGQAEQTSSRSAVAEAPATFVEGEWIVKLLPTEVKGGVSFAAGSAVSLAGQSVIPVVQLPSGAWLVRRNNLIDSAVAKGGVALSGAEQTLATATDMKADAQVEYVQLNYILETSSITPPSDPLLPLQQWHYGQIDVSGAWEVTTGDPSVRVAVIDTGTTPHPDLVYGAGQDFFDLQNPDSDPSDDVFHFITSNGIVVETQYHHGTHVMGIVGARSNDIGTVGVCPDCTIVPVRVRITSASVEQGVAWAADEGNADVITMSLNFSNQGSSVPLSCVDAMGDCEGGDIPSMCQTIEAVSDDVVVIASAGNFSSGAGAAPPANCPGVIGVAASQPDTALASYSNHGVDVALTAPGGGLGAGDFYGDGVDCASDPIAADPYDGTEGAVSTWAVGKAAGDLEDQDLCYRYLSGTSMSAPHVAGTVGLMLSTDPTLTPAEVAETLNSTADPDGVVCSVPGACGAGMLNAHAAVDQVAPVNACGGCDANSYCLEDTCQPNPTLTFDGGEGPSCGDMNEVHLPPEHLIRATLTGRPNAPWTKLNRHESCAGAVWWEAETGTFDADGEHEIVIGNADALSCRESTLGRWGSKIVVDGQESDEAQFRYYASDCVGSPNTCGAADSFCPATGACNGLGCPSTDSCGGCAVGSYCFAGECQPAPTLSHDGGEGPTCGNMSVAHPSPDYLVRVEITGRPFASWQLQNKHESCAGSVWWNAESGTLDAWGQHVMVLPHNEPLGCDSPIAGRWFQRVVVDGQVSDMGMFRYYETGCGTANSCVAATSFCPSSGAFNG